MITPRQTIEGNWILQSGTYGSGMALCSFIRTNNDDTLQIGWNKVWQLHGYINRLHQFDNDVNALTYLTRALTLNMLLDDNE